MDVDSEGPRAGVDVLELPSLAVEGAVNDVSLTWPWCTVLLLPFLPFFALLANLIPHRC